jgi:hypothetical protein
MATLKTNQTVSCKNLEDARIKADKMSNAIIIVKDNYYSLVNYKTFTELKQQGYIQAR